MGRVTGAAVLAIGGGLCLAPNFVPLLSSSSDVRPRGYTVATDGPQTSFTSAGLHSPGSGMPLVLMGTAALMTVRSTRMTRRAEAAKASDGASEEKTEAAPKESAGDKASPAESAAEAAAPADPTPPAEPAETKPAGFDMATAVGATPPLGFWDPAKLCKSEEQFKKFRVAELKHGRVAMMAALGAVVQHFISFPGFDEVPRGMEALTDGTGIFGFLLLFAASGYLELEQWNQKSDKEAGDFGDPLGLAGKIGEYDDEWRNRELNNGRFAMFAAMGIIVAENETGLDAVEQIFGL